MWTLTTEPQTMSEECCVKYVCSIINRQEYRHFICRLHHHLLMQLCNNSLLHSYVTLPHRKKHLRRHTFYWTFFSVFCLSRERIRTRNSISLPQHTKCIFIASCERELWTQTLPAVHSFPSHRQRLRAGQEARPDDSRWAPCPWGLTQTQHQPKVWLQSGYSVYVCLF